MSLKNNFVTKFFLAIILIFLDIFSKQLVVRFVELNQFISINFFFDIVYIRNYGISFGLLADLYSAWIFILIGTLITVFIIFIYIQSMDKFEKLGLAFIIIGAISNIIDRIFNGFVIDFISFHYKEFYWPAFNFADIYISVGVIIMLIYLLRNLKKSFKE